MDNLKVFKKMGRYFAAQITAINHSMQMAEQSGAASIGLESKLLVDAWNTLATDRNCLSSNSAY